MPLRIEMHRDAERRYRRSDRRLQTRLQMKIRQLAEEPRPKDSIALQGADDVYRVRVGGWRIVYSYTADTLTILSIGSRGQIYREF